ncbi:hypothetical protein GALMADRAFT_479890 [Galerina marginata CBS 339.88]|uniref:Uncharacterized protein n=1 Tax=Galerina marginata (strain CBS 339.88) TaxID=685588 RepID=A0A067T8Z3_GALM3|nr:hypothetical protein GALMADRAFT_479890 [Galerina marginata CBS 339.88]
MVPRASLGQRDVQSGANTLDQVCAVPFMSITKWESTMVSPTTTKPGAEKESSEAAAARARVEKLRDLGPHLWASADTNRTLHKNCLDGEGIELPLLNLTMGKVDRSCVVSQAILYLLETNRTRKLWGFSDFAPLTAYIWKKDLHRRRLILWVRWVVTSSFPSRM